MWSECGTIIIFASIAVRLGARVNMLVACNLKDARYLALEMTEAVTRNLEQTWDVNREHW